MFTHEQKEMVRDHLRKVLASNEFARSDRAAALLRYVVTQSLDDSLESLRERTIGIAVFERPQDWDPKIDTTVRTEARRVRKKLAGYYSSPAGEGHAVSIQVPVGGYVPTFEFRESQPSEESGPTEGNGTQPVKMVHPHSIPEPLRLASRSRVWLAVVGIILVACALLGFAFLSNATRTASQSGSEAFTSEYGHSFGPSISPDGRQIAYVWDNGKADYRIYIKPVQGGSAHRLTNSNSTELDPSWSPNGHQMAFLRVQGNGTDIIVRDVAEGTERTLGAIATQNGDWTGDPGPLIGNLGPSWTPDGESLIVSDTAPHAMTSGLFRVTLTDGARQQITNTQGSAEDFLPKISPDGHQLAFVRAISHGVSDIYIQNLQDGRLKKLTNEAHSINGLAWSTHSGQMIFSSDRQGAFQSWTVRIEDGSIKKLDTDSTTAIDPQIAANSDWMAYVSITQNWNIDQLVFDGTHVSPPTRLIASSGRNHTARYSPDGKHIAFVSDRSGTWEIWLCGLDCSEPQKLTDFHGPWIGGLNWSPDSQHLVFDARPGRNSAIYRLSITHSTPELIEKNQFEERMPSWSIDGRSLYFNSDRDGSVGIWKRDLETRAVRKISIGFSAQELDSAGDVLAGHPDGTLWRVNGATLDAEQLDTRVIVDPSLAWEYRNNALYFCRTDKGGAISVMEYADHHLRTIAMLSMDFPRTSASIDVSFNGSSLLVTSVDHSSSNIYRRIPRL